MPCMRRRVDVANAKIPEAAFETNEPEGNPCCRSPEPCSKRLQPQRLSKRERSLLNNLIVVKGQTGTLEGRKQAWKEKRSITVSIHRHLSLCCAVQANAGETIRTEREPDQSIKPSSLPDLQRLALHLRRTKRRESLDTRSRTAAEEE